jgi:hypothetical protein
MSDHPGGIGVSLAHELGQLALTRGLHALLRQAPAFAADAVADRGLIQRLRCTFQPPEFEVA